MSTDKNIYIDIWLVSLLTTRVVTDLLEDSPLSLDELAMYGLISDLAPITAADLVRATGLSPTTVSSILHRCEARGELVRTHNPEDGRSSLLALTEEGKRVLGAVEPSLIAGIEQLIRDLGGQYQQVRRALQDLDAALRRGLGVTPRPYQLESSDDGEDKAVAYSGPPLTADQAREVLGYVNWIRTRDK